MAAPIAETSVRIHADTSAFRFEAQRGIRGALTGLGASVAASPLGFGVVGGAALAFTLAAKEAIGSAADLEQQLNVFQATAGATAEQMAAVAKEAKRLGADMTLPATSSSDAAIAMTELAKGGLDVQDTLSGARGVLQLAAAGALDVAEAAGIAAQALNTFRLPGEDATRVADLLTGAANSATGEVTDFAVALQQAGAVAAQSGLSLDDTVTALAELAKNGLLGSDAGTSLRTTLLRLIPQSKEAAEIVRALGISFQDAAGNFRPLGAIFEQYRLALAKLTPVERQQALATIFGTDAIRAAAILTKEGAAGFDTMNASVTQYGSAAKFAAARTEGLKGSFGGLKSGAETLATSVGELAIPALTDLTETLGLVVTAANEGFTALEHLGDADIGGVDVGGLFDDLGHAVSRSLPGLGQLLTVSDKIKGALAPFFGTGDSMASFLEHAQSELSDRATVDGTKVGVAFTGGIGKGIESAEVLAVRQAKESLASVLAEGRSAVAEAIRQGDEAIAAATQQAKQNLVSIANDLAGQAAQIIDQGPLARRIAELQASLTAGQTQGQRSKLAESLKDAQKELEEAQASVSTGGKARTKAQQAAVDEFLTPFKRDVRDAKAALAEFNTEGVIAELQKEADAQKKVVAEGIADLVQQFNKGALSLDALSTKTAQLLKQNGVSIYGAAGQALGRAFKTEFLEELEALRKQAGQITIGPKTSTTGTEPNVVSVAGAIRDATQGVQAAQQSAAERLQAARDQLARASRDHLESIDEEAGTQTALLKSIDRKLGGTTTTGAQTSGRVRGEPIAGKLP